MVPVNDDVTDAGPEQKNEHQELAEQIEDARYRY